MTKNDLKINTIKNPTDSEINLLKEYMHQTIPLKQVTLIEKFQLIIKYNLYLYYKKSSADLEQYCEKIYKTNLKISPKDISTLKNFIIKINIQQNLNNKYLLDGGKILIDRKLSLSDVHNHYASFENRGQIIKNSEIEYFSSVKIYDFYKNSNDKNDKKDFFENKDIRKAMEGISDKVKKLEIISIIDNNDMHDVLSYLSKYHSEKVTIKHIFNNETSYIPSLFFVLIKCKLKKSNNYKHYIFYLENEINFGVARYVTKTNFSEQFYELLEQRFDTQFQNPNNINFNIKDEKDIFEDSVKIIIQDVKKLLDNNSKDFDIEINKLKNKIVSLKLHYPKMHHAYKLLSRLTKYVISVKNILNETDKQKSLNNTNLVINEIIEQKVNTRLDEILDHIATEQMYLDFKIDILMLRKSIFVNSIVNSKKALCDIFDELEWRDKKTILLSLKAIENNEERLNKLFSYFGSLNENLSFQEMRSLFHNRILKQIYNGKDISLI